MLKKGQCKFTNTRKLYDYLCKEYDFDKSKADNFGHQGAILYANDVSKEHYSVWCLTNTSWAKKKNYEKYSWYNEISKDADNCEIVETWNKNLWIKNDAKSLELLSGLYTYEDTRLTFVRCKDGRYFFLGVYKFSERDNENKIKKYKLVSQNYPFIEK